MRPSGEGRENRDRLSQVPALEQIQNPTLLKSPTVQPGWMLDRRQGNFAAVSMTDAARKLLRELVDQSRGFSPGRSKQPAVFELLERFSRMHRPDQPELQLPIHP